MVVAAAMVSMQVRMGGRRLRLRLAKQLNDERKVDRVLATYSASCDEYKIHYIVNSFDCLANLLSERELSSSSDRIPIHIP